MTTIPEEVLGLQVEVVRSMRRTAALHIVGSDLQVRVPEHLEDGRVAAILKQKRPWIRSKVAELQQVPPHRPRELVSGEAFPYLGRNYRLKVQEGHQVGVRLSGGSSGQRCAPRSKGHSGSKESSSTCSTGIAPGHWDTCAKRPTAMPSRSG